MVLLIDNYDSFSYNLYQLIGEITQNIKVVRNDEMTSKEIDELKPEAIVISPGPGKPGDAGNCEDIIKKLGCKYKILGVCLGHQAICEVYNSKIIYAKELMHGKQTIIKVNIYSDIFKGLDEKILVARYHSLTADKDKISKDLNVTAVTEDGEIMAVQHKKYKVYGVQFHPESIMTPLGKRIIENFLNA